MIAALVVTFNRRDLLERCLSALALQSQPPDLLLVIDNASTDGTPEWLQSSWVSNIPFAECIYLTSNRGGAGGFSAGMQIAMDRGVDWIWMMDDDAEPHANALHHLEAVADNPHNLYGSLAVSSGDTAWETTLLEDDSRQVTRTVTVNRVVDIPLIARVESLPFLGFMVHTNLMEQIGLPDSEFFLAADDSEYCQRARRSGSEIILVSESRIEHPKSERYHVRLLGQSVTFLSLPPWKRYYDTRNRLLIAYKYYGPLLLVTQTIPGSFIRLFAALRYEPRKRAQLWAFCAGFVDGLLKRKGKRHHLWHIQ